MQFFQDLVGVNHLKIKGSSTARRVAGRSGSKIDFSCTVREKGLFNIK